MSLPSAPPSTSPLRRINTTKAKPPTSAECPLPPNLHDCFPPPPRITICLHAHTDRHHRSWTTIGGAPQFHLRFRLVRPQPHPIRPHHHHHPCRPPLSVPAAEAKSIQLCVCVGFPDPPPACIPTSPPTTTTQCFPPLSPPRRPPVKLDPSISLTNSDKRASATRGDHLGTYACGA